MQRTATNQKNETDVLAIKAPVVEKADPIAVLRDSRKRVSIGSEELADEDPRYANVACTD